MLRRNVLSAVLFVLLAVQGQAALPVAIAPDDTNIVHMGRYSEDMQFGWTATGFRFRTDATAIEAVLELTASRRCALQVVVDSVPTKVLYLNSAETTQTLAADLDRGIHQVEVWKRTEGYMGQVRFGGLRLNSGATLLPMEPSPRRIMVIGDSISCGYGNEAETPKEGSTVENENGYMAYGPIAARALGAEVMMICWSGKGIYRDRGDKLDKAKTIPKIFDRSLPLVADSAWDHSRYVPHVIAINLGTNDKYRGSKGQKPELTKAMYLGAYRTFIDRLRTLYPDVKIIISIGPMGLEPMSDWLTSLPNEYSDVSVLLYKTPAEDRKSYIGGHWHPSVKMNKKMAAKLEARIREVCGW